MQSLGRPKPYACPALVDLCSKTIFYVTNRPKEKNVTVEEVPAGIHALSNARLDSPWSKSKESPMEFAQELAAETDQYNGFNLMLVDLCSKTIFYVTNRPKEKNVTVEEVPAGIHALSNARLDSPWSKVRYGTTSISAISARTYGEVCFNQRYLEEETWNE
ncbi:Transport and Golgi organization protein 2 [Dillenia turbinata]|uniref:Transport and Golgi organization protein 2 n=1 Tax=Dillenia turbinata TaxID=194707 RepID=A0AAN8USM7_9MAGN